MKAEDAPKTYEDLLDPKWKGKLCWAATAETGGAMMFITFIRLIMGEEKGEAYLRDLSKQNIANFTGSPREVVNKVMQGECAVALDIFLHHPVISAQKGAPVAPQPLEPVLSNASVVTLAKGATHPHAAMLLIDYLAVQGRATGAGKGRLSAGASRREAAGRASRASCRAWPISRNSSSRRSTCLSNRAKSIELQKKYFQSQ